MIVWGSDVGGNVVSFKGGHLETQLRRSGGLGLTLSPRIDKQGNYVPKLTQEEFLAMQGEKSVSSSDRILRRLNPYVSAMSLVFSGNASSK
jgi:hypothetical protein